MANLKDIKKGDKVIMRLFTGAFSGVKVVEKADKEFIYFTTGKGMSKFSRKTGKMVDPAPKNETYANYIEEFDEKVALEEAAKKEDARKKRAEKANKDKKAVPKKAPKKPDPDEDEDEDEEPAPPKKPAKKVAKKVAKKRSAEYEEID